MYFLKEKNNLKLIQKNQQKLSLLVKQPIVILKVNLHTKNLRNFTESIIILRIVDCSCTEMGTPKVILIFYRKNIYRILKALISKLLLLIRGLLGSRKESLCPIQFQAMNRWTKKPTFFLDINWIRLLIMSIALGSAY